MNLSLPLATSSPPLSLSLCLSFACSSDNFADRLSRFQQRDVVAFLSEETGVRARMLTVLFKLLRGRTKVLTAPHKGGVSRCLPRAFLRDDFPPRIVARAARGDENFSLEGQDAVTRLRGIPGGISRIIYRSGVARRKRRRDRRGRHVSDKRAGEFARGKSKVTLDMIRTPHRAGIFLLLP